MLDATSEFTFFDRLLAEDEREQSVVFSDPFAPDNPIIFVSPEFTAQTGYAPEEAIGRNCKFLQGPDTEPESVAKICAALEAREPVTVDILNYRKDGTPFRNRLRIRPIFDDRGALMFFAGAQNPIS